MDRKTQSTNMLQLQDFPLAIMRCKIVEVPKPMWHNMSKSTTGQTVFGFIAYQPNTHAMHRVPFYSKKPSLDRC